jgi:hypothetical protein
MRKGIGVCYCLYETPINASLPERQAHSTCRRRVLYAIQAKSDHRSPGPSLLASRRCGTGHAGSCSYIGHLPGSSLLLQTVSRSARNPARYAMMARAVRCFALCYHEAVFSDIESTQSGHLPDSSNRKPMTGPTLPIGFRRGHLCPNVLFLDYRSVEKRMHQRSNAAHFFFQCEMARVQNMELCARNISFEQFSTLHCEDSVVFAPGD